MLAVDTVQPSVDVRDWSPHLLCPVGFEVGFGVSLPCWRIPDREVERPTMHGCYSVVCVGRCAGNSDSFPPPLSSNAVTGQGLRGEIHEPYHEAISIEV
jgi:hypothetical protein